MELLRLLPSHWPWRGKYAQAVERPRVVYMVATPRTGSTLAKRYLGDHPQLLVSPNRRHHHAWRMARRAEHGCIVVDKRTNNIDKVDKIYVQYGNHAWFLVIVRDPRDQLVSLLETDVAARITTTMKKNLLVLCKQYHIYLLSSLIYLSNS